MIAETTQTSQATRGEITLARSMAATWVRPGPMTGNPVPGPLVFYALCRRHGARVARRPSRKVLFLMLLAESEKCPAEGRNPDLSVPHLRCLGQPSEPGGPARRRGRNYGHAPSLASSKAPAYDGGEPQGKRDQTYGQARSCPRSTSVPDHSHDTHSHRYGRTEHDQDSSKESEGRASPKARKTQQRCHPIEPGR